MKNTVSVTIAQFNNGDPNAYNRLYNRFQPLIFFLVRKIVPDDAQAEDITAETFIKLWNHRGDFENENNIVSFLRTTARNASIDWLRIYKKEQLLKEGLSHQWSAGNEDDYLEEIKAEVVRRLLEEIDRLPKRVQKVFKLSYLEGKTNEEIAILLGIHNQSVRNHKARALKTLRLSLTARKLLKILLSI